MGSPLPPSAVRVATILFQNGSAELDGSDRRVLKKVRNIYRQQGGRLRVVGHSSSRTRNMDPVRHKMVNYRISADRANVVIAALKRLGVSSNDITADARADASPLYFEYMPSGEAGNRRAEIYFE
ncbi:MAG TPA: OmpA family protein [Rhodospirillales bacterium]|nr:OmpA family protein [Rhodospirillales bacterium]